MKGDIGEFVAYDEKNGAWAYEPICLEWEC